MSEQKCSKPEPTGSNKPVTVTPKNVVITVISTPASYLRAGEKLMEQVQQQRAKGTK